MYKIIFCSRRAQEEIEDLPDGIRAGCKRLMLMVRDYGPQLPMPYGRQLGGGVWELRGRGREGIGRVMYAAVIKEEILILRTFVKKTQQTPHHELELAQKRLKEWIHAQNQEN